MATGPGEQRQPISSDWNFAEINSFEVRQLQPHGIAGAWSARHRRAGTVWVCLLCSWTMGTTMKRAYLSAIGIGAAAAVAAILASHVAAGPPQIDMGLIAGVVQLVEQDYVRPVSPNDLTDYALKGMLAHLDPHSAYMTEQEFRESSQDMSGKFGGIGLEIADHSGVPTVISPIDNTPAAHAGLQPGDVIASVDGHSTQGMDLLQVVRQIRGTPGSTVTLGISRGTKTPFDVPLTRSIIKVDSVKSKLEPDNVGYIRISQFGQTTAADFKQAITTLKQNAGGKLSGLVLDLRDDPGGLLAAAVDISGDLIDGGTVVSILLGLVLYWRGARSTSAA